MSKHKLQKFIIKNSKYVEETFKRKKFIIKFSTSKRKSPKDRNDENKIRNIRNKLYGL